MLMLTNKTSRHNYKHIGSTDDGCIIVSTRSYANQFLPSNYTLSTIFPMVIIVSTTSFYHEYGGNTFLLKRNLTVTS